MKSIRRTLTVGLLAGLVLLLGSGGAALYFTVRAVLLREFDSVLEAKARMLATLTKREGEHLELEFAEELMPEFVGGLHPSYFQVWRPDGKLLERSPSLRHADLPQRVAHTGSPLLWDSTLPNGRSGRAISLSFVPEDERDDMAASPPQSSPAAMVVVSVERSELDRQLFIIAVSTGIFATVMAASAVVLAWIVIHRAFRPLAKLADDVSGIDADTLGARLPAEQLPTELEPICTRLNELLARLQMAFERERSFSADVAHELRTPVAELRTLAETALKWPTGDRETQAAFADALAVAEQMQGIVNGLLLMARCENGIQQVQLEPLALGPLVQEAWRPFAAQAGQKRVSVRFELPQRAMIQSDRALIQIMLGNFFSNAAEYTREGGELSVSAAESGGSIILRIANSVADLTPTDVPRIFDRFWRKSEARTSSFAQGLVSRSPTSFLNFLAYGFMPTSPFLALSQFHWCCRWLRVLAWSIGCEKTKNPLSP